jgi:hypothetical protein
VEIFAASPRLFVSLSIFKKIFRRNIQMDAKGIHQQALQFATMYLEMVMAEVTPEQAHWTPPGTAQTIAATYAHAVLATDWQIHDLFRGLPALYGGEWAGKTGVNPPSPAITPEWGKTVQVDLPQLKAYAQAVYAGLMAYVENVDLEQQIDMSIIGMGMQTVSWCLSTIVAGHLCGLTGEIAILKGIQGLKGDAF